MFLSGLSIAVKTDDKNNTIIVCVHFTEFFNQGCEQRGIHANTCFLKSLTCSFLISFLRSASYFSFWFALAALCS